jgi:ABC-2 type transport system permease protein/sodium transport system permease protein
MTRFTRINAIWRKELIDTLRDRRTLIAMVVVPMVLYPAMMLGSVQGFELQLNRLKHEEYRIAVASNDVRAWLRHLLDSDPARQPGAAGRTAEELVELSKQGELGEKEAGPPAAKDKSAAETARASVREHPPTYQIDVVGSAEAVTRKVRDGELHVGVLVSDELPTPETGTSAEIALIVDQTDIRSQIASSGLQGVLERAGDILLGLRLERLHLTPAFIKPIGVREEEIALPEKVGGSILGRIVPLILIVMTITGAIYPAIDLTAGERERGTLETLMVAPVPTVDLIAGKFVVVALIAMLSALLNLLSIGGTIYFGGLGDLLTRGGQMVIPLNALPWVLLILIPLAVMFSAVLLAVCSFARSFKEAQNYVMPVMIAALIPAVVGILPGTRLEGALLVMPVANIVILSRDLFTGRFDVLAILWVTLFTCLYAGAAVAVAAKLFGQEAVLFADSGSIKTLFQRRHFQIKPRPTSSAALLLLAVVFSANFFVQQALAKTPGVVGTMWFWWGITATIVVLFAGLPLATAAYMKVRIRPAFGLALPRPAADAAAVCFGFSTWILAQGWFAFQSTWMEIPQELEQALQSMEGMLGGMNPLVALFFLALVPAVCEELFFRGFVLNGLRGPLGKWAAVLIVAVAFGVHHHLVFRLIATSALGLLLGLLVVQFRSLWPAMLAHAMHNGISLLASREDCLKPLLTRWGYVHGADGMPPTAWLIGAAVLLFIGIVICLRAPAQDGQPEPLG